MTEGTATDGDTAAALLIDGTLSPADAEEAHGAALQAVEAAKAGGLALQVDVEGDQITPCALQILVATQRTTDAQGIDIALSPRASEIFTTIDLN